MVFKGFLGAEKKGLLSCSEGTTGRAQAGEGPYTPTFRWVGRTSSSKEGRVPALHSGACPAH